MTNALKYSQTERAILRVAGGPITAVTADDRARGLATFNRIRRAMGNVADVKSPALFCTFPNGNVKLSKDETRWTGGATYAPATAARRFLADAPAELVEAVAGAAGVVLAALVTLLRRWNMCPRATAQCVKACLIETSGQFGTERDTARKYGRSWYTLNCGRAKLARTILLMTDPRGAVALMVAGIEATAATADKYGKLARWRLAIADDVRWELVAPVILETCRAHGVGMYAYTKFSPEDRPAPANVTLVRSVSDRWTVANVIDTVRAGHTVAMVVDIGRNHAVPAEWCGLPVVDGDKSDDRTADPAGVVVMLRAKGDAIKIPAGKPRSFVFPGDTAGALARHQAEQDRRKARGPFPGETAVNIAPPVVAR